MDRGVTTILELIPPSLDEEGGDEWEVPWWRSLVLPNDEGELHHGSRGARMPDTVVVEVGGREVALADIFAHTLENQYCYDAEYFLIVRLRELLDPEAWAALPCGACEPGDVFLAYDKFHGHEYLRTPGDDRAMSYGGDWSDLQAYIDDHHPRPEGARPTGPPSSASLLRAVREGDEAKVRALLAAGADPNAGLAAPDEALRSVSVDRDTSALWEAVMGDAAGIVEALLAAGASVEARSSEHMSPLHGALRSRKLAVVPALIRFGADPDARFQGKSARELAAAIGPEALALLAPSRR
ncbi:MAG: hypothetical protein H6711_18340 [Myxococcales bacterium]|nr:hypothetical protein [Myxococcales bacterium]